ncbi:hypothetical protein EIP91_011250 [Steccherinum ochraceum]|uniref:Bms1-type G domain-containing protein n=1 Tax=Steccherinum ochraceum TaxID=92696 RepID=A0A4R0RYP2_9APHY|nr:hypothetical protein EIP91_011250 [Steccherinum ochraceum]
MVQATHHHRPTLKQQNKPFKSKHATKGSLKEIAKGRLARENLKAGNGTNSSAQNRLNRKNQAKQHQSQKRQALVSATRLFSGVDGAPRIVAIIPLTADVRARDVAQSLKNALSASAEECPAAGLWKLKAERFKTSLQFILLPHRHLYAALDACKVADYVVFALSSEVEVDAWGDTLLRTLQAQGLPEVVTVVAPSSPMEPKAKTGIMKSLLSFIQYFVPSQQRVFDLLASSDALNAARALCEGKPEDVKWRDGRSYIVGERVEMIEGLLAVTGVVRGAPLSGDRLIHLPTYGDFQVAKIMSAALPRGNKNSNQASMDVESTLLAEPNAEDADSLVSSNDPDDMVNEQTWPTEEEMRGAEGYTHPDDGVPGANPSTTPKRVKKVPKGMSEYQAAWIIDESEDEDDNEAEGEGGDGMEMEEAEEMVDLAENDDDTEMDSRTVAFEDLDMEEEGEQLKTWRDRKREEDDDAQFPDEIDTPMDVPARTRFQRYRGLRSLRTSPWDPFENLPRDYARIFQFEDYKRTERAVRRRAEEDTTAVQPGTRVTIYLKGHEHKKSVLNFSVQRNTEYDGSVRSKDPLILCIGARRFRVNPTYSQHTRGGGKGPNNVHKFERYLRHGNTSIATVYGPVTFGNLPCILLKETGDEQAPDLVGMGSYRDPDTTRVVAKRIVLSGHPFKVHRKTATVRYMFFSADDVHYFKPIQLHTKLGRTGHIRESLGTHGYFKAHFDGQVSQMDTVCMSLYKRVYPKWCELSRGGALILDAASNDVDADAMMQE